MVEQNPPRGAGLRPQKAEQNAVRFEVEVIYCGRFETAVQSVRVEEGCTILDALIRSRLMDRFPEIDLRKNATGIFGTIKKTDAKLSPGDRVEVYRAITCDPEAVPRRDEENSQ